MNTGAEDKDHELDQWLDAALARDGNVEPRPGLESRVLTSLEAEKTRGAERQRWWWALGAAGAAAMLAVAMWIVIHTRQPLSNRTAGNSKTRGLDVTVAATAGRHRPRGTRDAHIVARGPRRAANSGIVVHAPERKLDQFPSPQPLADQEQMLLRYVREFPGRAILVARAQTQLRKQEEQEMLVPVQENSGPTRSDETE